MFHNPRATQLTFLGGYRIRVELEDNVFGDVDLSAELRAREFEALRDRKEFAAAHIDHKGIIVWPCGAALAPSRLFLQLKLQQFSIGAEFVMSDAPWRCTDVGVRTITAIKLDHGDNSSWYNGPPYAVAEHVIDEYELEICELAPADLQLARERMNSEFHATPLAAWKGRDRKMLRKREEIREPVQIKYRHGSVAVISRDGLTLQRAQLEALAPSNAAAARLLVAKSYSAAAFTSANTLLDEYC